MVAIYRQCLGLYLVFGRILPAASTITLSYIQSVTGFPEACTDAYNTPLLACTKSDFEPGQPCSKACIIFLDDLTATIHKACQRTKAPLDTLMGRFFIFEGTTAICPNARGSTGSDTADGIDVQPTITVASDSIPSHVPESITDSSAESPEATILELATLSSVVVSPVSTTSTSPRLPDVTLATFTTSVIPPDPAIAPATSVTTIPLSVLTAVPTTMALIAKTTEMTTEPKATFGGGGGTPFDITSLSVRNLRSTTLGISVMVGCVVLTWLL